jgi:hypothetical protein
MLENHSATKQVPVDFHAAIHTAAYDLVRDPDLRQTLSLREAEIIDAVVEKYRRRLESVGDVIHLTELKRLPTLTELQQKELAALVLDIDSQCYAWQQAESYLSGLRHRSKRGPGHVRKLAGKIASIQEDLATLVKDAGKVDVFFADGVVPYVTEALDVLAAVKLIPPSESVQEYSSRMSSWYDQVIGTQIQVEDPRRSAAVRLVQYLREIALLKASDANVRTARIGNAFWAWGYAIRANDFGVTDCDGVRLLVSRVTRPDRQKSRQQ